MRSNGKFIGSYDAKTREGLVSAQQFGRCRRIVVVVVVVVLAVVSVPLLVQMGENQITNKALIQLMKFLSFRRRKQWLQELSFGRGCRFLMKLGQIVDLQ